MNAGARVAGGDVLCFVHADTRPPLDLVDVVNYELQSSPGTVAGGFVTRIAHKGRLLWWMTAHHCMKTYYMPALLRPYAGALGLRCLLGMPHRGRCL